MAGHKTLEGADLCEELQRVAECHSEETHGRGYREKSKLAMSDTIVQWVKDNLHIGRTAEEAKASAIDRRNTVPLAEAQAETVAPTPAKSNDARLPLKTEKNSAR